jgi:hypothetical protein
MCETPGPKPPLFGALFLSTVSLNQYTHFVSFVKGMAEMRQSPDFLWHPVSINTIIKNGNSALTHHARIIGFEGREL